MKNIYSKNGIYYKYYLRPSDSLSDLQKPIIETDMPVLEVMIQETDNGYVAEIKNLSIKIEGESYDEIESELKIKIRHILNHRREFIST